MEPTINASLFWLKVKKGQPDECWEWISLKRPRDYGSIRCGKKTLRAHRVAWFLTNGNIPSGLCVCHRCDNPPCCNPAHLFLGTYRDNKLDSIKKGRSKAPVPPPHSQLRGEQINTSKLSPKQVLWIRANVGKISIRKMAKQFGVWPTAVANIVHGRSWKHISLAYDELSHNGLSKEGINKEQNTMISLSFDNGGSVLFLSEGNGFRYRAIPPIGRDGFVKYFSRLIDAIAYAKHGRVG